MIFIDTQKEEFAKLKDIRVFGKDDEEESFNSDLLVIGLGGIGCKVLTSFKGMIRDDVSDEDNINLLYIDSDISDMQQTIEDSKEGLGLNALEVMSIYRPNLETILSKGIDNNPVHPNLANWMKKDFPNITIGIDGAKGNRQIGRLMFSNAYEDIRILLFEKLEELYEKSGNKRLDIIIVSSVAGGTGSGILSDLAYNIKAFGKSKKWDNYRIGACLLTPDVLFANTWVNEDAEKKTLLNANGCATLKEIDYYMRLANRYETFSFESTTHRLTMRENIFDACMLISGKKDEQGYLPDGVICSDVAYFVSMLSKNKYIGSEKDMANRKLLRDVFFDKEGSGYYKIVNESDFKVPVKEIENICEYEIFNEANKKLHNLDNMQEIIQKDLRNCLIDVDEFLDGKPGDAVNLNVKGLININQLTKPDYRSIKKKQDTLRTSMPRQLADVEKNIPNIIKGIKAKMTSDIEGLLSKYMREYGPFLTIDMIGSAGFAGRDEDGGMITEIRKLENKLSAYQPTGEFSRIIESIRDMVAKKFFAFPSAKRETENGYYDACIKETLATERNMIIDGMSDQDLFGDIVRMLRQKSERLNDIYAQFGEDLKNAVEDLANRGKRVTDYTLKNSVRHEFLPSDYITDARVNEIREGIINLMIEHEADIDSSRPVPVKDVMERIYKNIFVSVGVYAPEKLLSVAFAEKKPTLQETNIMFVSATNENRDIIMERAAKSFAEGLSAKSEKKKLCLLREGSEEKVISKRFISLPAAMPHFSEAVKETLINEPYNIPEETIAFNHGEIEISIDDILAGVPLSLLECAREMQDAYDSVDKEAYFGLHTDEVGKDMVAYPDIC
ncbi:MAG: tubulin-like doman-containing protein [Lachnospiraceae bacterium]|nr:tubulin-like doman-containing protein [Lachnospiraceae bacterium]